MRAKTTQTCSISPDSHGRLLLALWTLTRQAKRDRDRAQGHYQSAQITPAKARRYYRHSTAAKGRKELYYRLKGQALVHLVAEGVLAVTGLHRFGGQYAELVEGAGFRFHRPCPPPAVPPEGGVPDLGQSLKSRPKKKSELGVRAALACVREYLDGKPEVAVYQWPAPSRGRAVQCWNCGGFGHLARDCWEDDEDEWDDEDGDEAWDEY